MAIPPPESTPPRAHEPETWALRALGAATAEASGALARRMRMHPTDLSAMSHVAASDGHLGPRELSTRLGITPAAMTDVVDRLEAAGHLLRERDTADRRRVRLVPTESAATEVRGQLRSLLDRLDALTHEFSDGERDAIHRYLRSATEVYHRFAADDPTAD
ncbi:MarR family winged helix-turn-helix transcriptional regulator [Terrabacter aerolatus]|uniref:MarR family transcriptional regulator n=1 Tax=Terrabacter aerolatus TaxID=422442 RepID=A0A512D2I4_9MICO|nr:MarR family transcriptional regulator [Terrabacter aerolatus]GEO30677.1 MarR family transcriptional regulator [Terrabacter aerolatus]